DNRYHPNPGTEETEYDEIERPVDWLIANGFLSDEIEMWLYARIAALIDEDGYDADADMNEIVNSIMYSDSYQVDSKTRQLIGDIYAWMGDEDNLRNCIDINESQYARDIARFINENFLRIRAGGKLNPDGTNSIYFRISSHGYDWRRNIENFLRDTFDSPDKMPNYIWIGHDAETNPPEVTLFEGTPNDFIEQFDSKVIAHIQLD
ncbi:MAG: hypothetical protein SO075_03585, partial [Eubacteriales bacterium]|nr:hypothetical protein [Eubacteriales bacterium]